MIKLKQNKITLGYSCVESAVENHFDNLLYFLPQTEKKNSFFFKKRKQDHFLKGG